MPGVIADRFFALIDDNENARIEFKEFMTALLRIYCADLEQQYKVAFEVYDFNKDGVISREEVRLVLSYVPLEGEVRYIFISLTI